jgi:hypothetical protein
MFYEKKTWRAPRFGFRNDYSNGWMCYQWQTYTYNALEPIVKGGKCFNINRVGTVARNTGWFGGTSLSLENNWIAITARGLPGEKGGALSSVPAGPCTVYLNPWQGNGPAAFQFSNGAYGGGHPTHNFVGNTLFGPDPSLPTGIGGIWLTPEGEPEPASFEDWSY